MFFLSLIITIAVLALFVFIGYNIGDGAEDRKRWSRFYAEGKESGFNIKEIELLRQLAMKNKLDEPSDLFYSLNKLDACIHSLAGRARVSGQDQSESIQTLIAKLYECRKKIEMDQPLILTGITDSHKIEEKQALRILVSGAGVFKSQLIKNTGQYMTITRPTRANLPQGFSWTGQRLAVYFWRDNDAGYVFDTDVLDEVYSKGQMALQISHSGSLFRTQKRQSFRHKTHKPAFLYILDDEAGSEGLESKPGLKCVMEDISDTGCAVIIGGKAVGTMRVKIQFILNDALLVMCGTVRSIDYKLDVNRSLLHIQADPLPVETRNCILEEIFGMPPEEDEIFPPDAAEEALEEKFAEREEASESG